MFWGAGKREENPILFISQCYVLASVCVCGHLFAGLYINCHLFVGFGKSLNNPTLVVDCFVLGIPIRTVVSQSPLGKAEDIYRELVNPCAAVSTRPPQP